mgnify:CR=1 FL=1
MMFSHQFHRCNAWVYPYEKPVLHEVLCSYETEVCISAYIGDELHLWLRNGATRLSRTTTRQICRYLGERARGYNPHPYMPVNLIRRLIAGGPGSKCEYDSTVYVYRGSMFDYSDKALESSYNGR